MPLFSARTLTDSSYVSMNPTSRKIFSGGNYDLIEKNSQKNQELPMKTLISFKLDALSVMIKRQHMKRNTNKFSLKVFNEK